MTRLIFNATIAFFAQAAMVWYFYRCRVVSHTSWAESDFVVFALPCVAGFAMVVAILSFGSRRKRIGEILVLSTAGTVAALLLGSVIAFNLYGT